jgi:type I restriction enzyme S subunit
MNVVIGSSGVTRWFGAISPVYYALFPRTAEYNVWYYHQIFRLYTFQRSLLGLGNGILMHRMRIPLSNLNNVNLPVPPLDEQNQIVRFLDWKVSRINKLTNALKKQIALLTEQKRAVINEAMTKGLDPNAPMKDSGVAWLGDVPEHWSIYKLKHVAVYKSGDNLTSLQITDIGEFPVYGGNGFRGFYSSHNYSGNYLVVGRQGALCGNVHRMNGDFWATDHAVTVKPVAGVDIEWLHYLLLTMNLNQYSRAAAQPGLSVEYVINVQTIFPDLSEQIVIAKWIKEQEKPVDSIIEKNNRQISLLTEYRTRLISDVVTGKLDVRGVVVPEYDMADTVIDEELPEDEDDNLSDFPTGSQEDV